MNMLISLDIFFIKKCHKEKNIFHKSTLIDSKVAEGVINYINT